MNRELSVSLLAAFLLTFTAWSWGGVVLWTQFATAALGLLALGVAVLPSRSPGQSTHPGGRLALLSSLLGLAAAAAFVAHDLFQVLRSRDATLQLIPGAELPPLRFSDWGLRGLLVGMFVGLLALIFLGIARSPDSRLRLVRFLPFWLGLFLFAWIACQSWNTWGVVVQRDLFWRILPRDYITWLPSGLDAPFASVEEPGGMNGWRQLLILVGPWALLCSLHTAVDTRRNYAWLAFVAGLNAVGVALVGNLAQAQKWTDFLGFAHPDMVVAPFGPFVYRNHAGAFVFLALVVVSALTFYLAKRKGDRVDRGGPHLLTALLAVFLALGAASTMSFGVVAATGVFVVLLVPLAYLLDTRLRAQLTLLPIMGMACLVGVVVYAGLASADAGDWRRKILRKQRMVVQGAGDDREALRSVTFAMLQHDDMGRLLSGWGAGSYRWTTPPYMAKEPLFLNKDGQLVSRATHAHNDWLQCLVEWGLAGAITCLSAIYFLLARVRRAVVRPRAPAIALGGGLCLFAGHAYLDFLLFIPQLTLLAVLVAWLLALETAEDSPAR